MIENLNMNTLGKKMESKCFLFDLPQLTKTMDVEYSGSLTK